MLTQLGNTFAGRVAASLNCAVGMNDLVVTSPSEYEALAVRLATHPEHLDAIRKKLAENKCHMPLFNTSLYTRRCCRRVTQVAAFHDGPPSKLHVNIHSSTTPRSPSLRQSRSTPLRPDGWQLANATQRISERRSDSVREPSRGMLLRAPTRRPECHQARCAKGDRELPRRSVQRLDGVNRCEPKWQLLDRDGEHLVGFSVRSSRWHMATTEFARLLT